MLRPCAEHAGGRWWCSLSPSSRSPDLPSVETVGRPLPTAQSCCWPCQQPDEGHIPPVPDRCLKAPLRGLQRTKLPRVTQADASTPHGLSVEPVSPFGEPARHGARITRFRQFWIPVRNAAQNRKYPARNVSRRQLRDMPAPVSGRVAIKTRSGPDCQSDPGRERVCGNRIAEPYFLFSSFSCGKMGRYLYEMATTIQA